MVALDALTNRNDILPVLFGHTKADILFVWLSHAENSLQVFAEAFFILAFYAILQKAKVTALFRVKKVSSTQPGYIGSKSLRSRS